MFDKLRFPIFMYSRSLCTYNRLMVETLNFSYMYILLHVYIYTYVYIYIHIYIYIYIYIYKLHYVLHVCVTLYTNIYIYMCHIYSLRRCSEWRNLRQSAGSDRASALPELQRCQRKRRHENGFARHDNVLYSVIYVFTSSFIYIYTYIYIDIYM